MVDFQKLKDDANAVLVAVKARRFGDILRTTGSLFEDAADVLDVFLPSGPAVALPVNQIALKAECCTAFDEIVAECGNAKLAAGNVGGVAGVVEKILDDLPQIVAVFKDILSAL